MTSFYSELQDHDAPPSRSSLSRRTSGGGDRRSRTSEMSLNLDDLENLHLQRTSSHRTGSGDHSNNIGSGFSLSSWAQEPEATTGNLMFGASSAALSNFLKYSSLDSVLEDGNDEEFTSSAMLSTNEIYDNGRQRPRHYSDDDSLLLRQSKGNTIASLQSCMARSRSWDGTLMSGSLSELDVEIDDEQPGKRVHFAVTAQLEDVREFEKPDFEDYNNLYYMAHELQTMMDDFRQETELDRQIIR